MTSGKRILVFIGLNFGITYAFEIFVIGNLLDSNIAALLVSLVMFFPALCMVLTRLITKEGFSDLWIAPNFRGRVRYYLTGWLLPILLTVVGAVLYFLVFPGKFDPNVGYFTETLAAAGQNIDVSSAKTILYLQIASAVVIAPIANIINTLGEEWGWRGYLLPKMLGKFKAIPALLLSGVIWGLWHAPLIVMGHNYGTDYEGYPYMGILAMCGFCVVMGVLFSYVTLRTHSCLPAAIAHAMLNGFASAGLYFLPDSASIEPFVGPSPTGIIGGAGFIVTMVVLVVLIVRDEKKGQLIAPMLPRKAKPAEPQVEL